MKNNNIKKAAQESLQQIEKHYGPQAAAKAKAARQAYGEHLFVVIGGGPIHEFDRFILREGYHLCLDCFIELNDAQEEQAEKASTLTITINTRR